MPGIFNEIQRFFGVDESSKIHRQVEKKSADARKESRTISDGQSFDCVSEKAIVFGRSPEVYTRENPQDKSQKARIEAQDNGLSRAAVKMNVGIGENGPVLNLEQLSTSNTIIVRGFTSDRDQLMTITLLPLEGKQSSAYIQKYTVPDKKSGEFLRTARMTSQDSNTPLVRAQEIDWDSVDWSNAQIEIHTQADDTPRVHVLRVLGGGRGPDSASVHVQYAAPEDLHEAQMFASRARK